MGVYQYTLRAGTKTVAGTEIGHLAFAYKRSWEWQPGTPNAARYEAAACRAHDKLTGKGVRHFTKGPFERADCDGGLAVYFAPNGLPHQVCEEVPASFPRVGTLEKVNGKLVFFDEAAHLVGTLNGEDAAGNYKLEYYVTDRDENGESIGYPRFDTFAEARDYAAAKGLAARWIADAERQQFQRALAAAKVS